MDGRRDTPIAGRRLAIVAFFPDWGHVQPLIRIAAAARAAGVEVMCFVPEQARPLVEQQGLNAEYFPNAASPETMATFRKLGGRSTFFREFSGHAHHDLLIVPETIETIGRALPVFAERIKAFAPHMIASDFAVFGDHYRRMARSLGVPLAKSHPSYGLAALHRVYVQTYGLGDASGIHMRAVELLGAGFKFLYRHGYYAAGIGRYLRLRRLKAAFETAFARTFPPGGPEPEVTEIMSAIGWVERHFLRGEVALPKGFRTFPPRRLASQELAGDVADWLASAPDKVVYVSFGSMVSLGARHREALFRQLERTGARILWSAPKEECAHLAALADGNRAVFVTSYVAQTALLRRPEIACFVTHGGASSAIEGWSGATPMLCIPFFTDQPYIASIIEEMGTGLKAWKAEIGSAAFGQKLARILSGAFAERTAEVSAELARYEDGEELQRFIVETIGAPPVTGGANRES